MNQHFQNCISDFLCLSHILSAQCIPSLASRAPKHRGTVIETESLDKITMLSKIGDLLP